MLAAQFRIVFLLGGRGGAVRGARIGSVFFFFMKIPGGGGSPRRRGCGAEGPGGYLRGILREGG